MNMKGSDAAPFTKAALFKGYIISLFYKLNWYIKNWNTQQQVIKNVSKRMNTFKYKANKKYSTNVSKLTCLNI